MIITELRAGYNSDLLDHVEISALATAEEIFELQLLRTFEIEIGGNDELPDNFKIRRIKACEEPGKEKVIVTFEDGSRVVKSLKNGDTFDLNIGVALAVMEKIYGTKSQYHKVIQSKLKTKK